MTHRFSLTLPFGTIGITLGQNGVKELRLPNGTPHRATAVETASRVTSALKQNITRQLQEYAAGKRKRFAIPLDLTGHTRFRQRVWQEMAQIPWGQTMTYGMLAQRLGKPGAARAVGQACGANPIPILIPCHRVIAAGGALGGFSSGLENKQALLTIEEPLIP